MLLLPSCIKNSSDGGGSCGAYKGLAEEDVGDHLGALVFLFFFFFLAYDAVNLLTFFFVGKESCEWFC